MAPYGGAPTTSSWGIRPWAPCSTCPVHGAAETPSSLGSLTWVGQGSPGFQLLPSRDWPPPQGSTRAQVQMPHWGLPHRQNPVQPLPCSSPLSLSKSPPHTPPLPPTTPSQSPQFCSWCLYSCLQLCNKLPHSCLKQQLLSCSSGGQQSKMHPTVLNSR